MSIASSKAGSANLRTGFLSGVGLGLALVLLGWGLVPAASPLSVGAAGLILVVYGLAGYFGIARLSPQASRLAGIFGLLAGLVFAGEMILEYVFLPKDNTIWGYIEFGTVFALFFIAGLAAAYQSGSLRQGLLTGVASAMLGSLIWLSVVLLMFYIFRGSARQVQVFTAEGDYADFAASGMKDFNAYIMEDFFGACFYHLLLGPVVAAILAGLGGLVGKGLACLRARQAR